MAAKLCDICHVKPAEFCLWFDKRICAECEAKKYCCICLKPDATGYTSFGAIHRECIGQWH